jgi:hypothetical protein
MLDLQEQANKKSYADDLGGIESDRAKELLKDSRDAAKEQITIEKESTQARLEIESDYFEQWMALITEYTPLTVGEFQTMTDQINQLLINAGATWPEHATTAMERFNDIFANANRDVVDEFRKSGNAAVTAWMESFIGSEELKVLKAMASSGGGGGGGGGGDGSGSVTGDGSDTTPDAAAPEDAGMSFEEQQKKYKKTRLAFDPNLHNVGSAGAANETFDVTAKNQAQQNLIDMIKVEIERGDTRNKGIEEYNIAMQQLKADAYAAYHTMSDEEGKAHTQSMKNIREKLVGQDAVFSGDNRAVGSIRRMTDEVKFHTDKSGIMYEQVGDRMVDSYGRSFKILKDEHGNMTGNIVDNNGKIIKINEKTFTNAQSLLQEMMDKGIKPGTAAAADYIRKINDLGGAVYELPNGKTIVIDADTSKLYETINKVNAFFKLNNKSGGGYVGMDGIEMLAQEYANSQYQGAITNTPFGRFRMEADGSQTHESKWASGGLVKAQKDGILANIGEGGYDEFVISTDPKYRAQSIGYLSAAASRLGVGMASRAAAKAASSSASISYGGSKASEYAGGGSGDVYISVDTFIGEEQWFAELAGKYNMKTVPRQRKLEGQQKRVVSSYNDRYRLR